MSYTKQTWSTGDTVTAAKLNHMEDGIAEAGGGSSGGGVLVVHDVDGTLDKTYSEILQGGFGVIETVSEEEAWYYPILAVYAAPDGTEYNVFAATGGIDTISQIKYSTSSADGYPEYAE